MQRMATIKKGFTDKSAQFWRNLDNIFRGDNMYVRKTLVTTEKLLWLSTISQ